MDKFLVGWENLQKENNGQDCYDQKRHKSTFVLSVDLIMDKEKQVVLATLSQVISSKIDEPISHVTSWVNGQISISVARS